MRHSTVVGLLCALAAGLSASGQEASYLPGCNQREYVYVGGRLLALVDSSPGVTLGFLPPASTSVAESGAVTLTVTLSQAAACPVTVGYSTADGTARSDDGDYVPASGVLTFTPGVTSRDISVTINPDTKFEPDETFSVVLTNPTGGSVGGGTRARTW